MTSALYVVTFFMIINASSYEKRCLQFLMPAAVFYIRWKNRYEISKNMNMF